MEFQELQQHLTEKINLTRSKKYNGIYEKSDKLQLSDAFFCAEDIVRNKRFYNAIESAMGDLKGKCQEENIGVIDAGSGTGILGIMALMLGADHVTFIEANPHTLEWSRDFIESLGLSQKCSFCLEDATSIKLSEKYHLLLSETITIDFCTEDFHKIVTHLKQFLFPKAVIIPERFEILSEKMTYSFSSYDDISNISLPRTGELSGICYLYKGISIKSQEAMSFFNEKNNNS